MRLRVENFAKVKVADIILDGITVIAGKNNTGKSTIGKVLDSMYNAASNLEVKMENARKSRLQRLLLSSYHEHVSYSYIRNIVGRIYRSENENDERKILAEYYNFMYPDKEADKEAIIERWFEEIEQIRKIPDEIFIRTIISKYFEEVFNGMINNAEHGDTDAKVEIQTKSGRNTLIFRDDACVRFEQGYKIANSSVYIDNPLLIDKLNNSEVKDSPRWYLSEQEYNLYIKLKGEKSTAEEKAINEIINREKLDEAMRLLNQVIPGEIVFDQKYEYKTDKVVRGIDIRSMSTGLKSFAVLKQLIMNGSLNDGDAVVLDEPEIHLHPEWQMVYAEIIVVLQKICNFNFIINTHSSHFLETLDFYAAKYGRKEICHYYLSEETEGLCRFDEVTETPEKIYKQLVDPSLLLAKEKEIWEDEHESI